MLMTLDRNAICSHEPALRVTSQATSRLPEDAMPAIHFLDVTNRDGVQTARTGLSKFGKIMVNSYLGNSAWPSPSWASRSCSTRA